MLNTLNVSQTGLAASRAGVENVQNNVANENTPGYKRRVLGQSEIIHSDERFFGRGTKVDGVDRITSIYMSRNLMRETHRESYTAKTAEMIGNIEIIFKETEGSGLSKDLNRYLESMENLRSNPSSEVYKFNLITQANQLVSNLKDKYTSIEKSEELEKVQLGKDVDTINSMLRDIGDINDQLGKQQIASNDLLDRRDRLEMELSKYANIDVSDEHGTYTLKIGNVVAVGNNTVIREINVNETYSPQKDKFIKDDGTSPILDGVTFDNDDKITYKLDNTHEVSVKFGEAIDTDGDSIADLTVDSTNYVRAMAYKINNDPDMSKMVVAYNGEYVTDSNGKRTTDDSQDNFLFIEAKDPGEKGAFKGNILVTEQTDDTDPTTVTAKKTLYKNDYQSSIGTNSVELRAFDAPITLTSGSIKAQTENLTTEAANNKFKVYKEKLDNFAQTLSDITGSFVKTGTDTYMSGNKATDTYTGDQTDIKLINLFSGSSVKTLTFNDARVKTLDQTELDYLATLQWKKDIAFDGKAQDGTADNKASFAEYLQSIRVNISSDKEASDFLLKTQKSVKNAVANSFDKLTKVDRDEEMLNLMKFQSAYTANAKVVTTIDEMLQVILGIKK